MTLDRLFVYGTLRPRCHAFDLIAALVEHHEEAVLPHHRLVGEGHRYPWCIESPGSEVAGDLLWLASPEEVLRLTDEYEGIRARRPEYRRVVLEVLTADGLQPAWVYVGGPGVPSSARRVAGGDWAERRELR